MIATQTDTTCPAKHQAVPYAVPDHPYRTVRHRFICHPPLLLSVCAILLQQCCQQSRHKAICRCNISNNSQSTAPCCCCCQLAVPTPGAPLTAGVCVTVSCIMQPGGRGTAELLLPRFCTIVATCSRQGRGTVQGRGRYNISVGPTLSDFPAPITTAAPLQVIPPAARMLLLTAPHYCCSSCCSSWLCLVLLLIQ